MIPNAKQKIFHEPDINIQERRCKIEPHKDAFIIAFKITDTIEYQCLYCKKEDEAKKESQNQLQVKYINIIEVGKLLMNKYKENKENLAKIIQKQFNFIKDVKKQLSDITKLFVERIDQFKQTIQNQLELNKLYEQVFEDPTQFYNFQDKSIQRQLLVFDSTKMYNANVENINLWLSQLRIKIDEQYSQLQSTFQQYLPKQQNQQIINPPKQLTQSEIIVAKNLLVLNEAREAYLLQDYNKALQILKKFDYKDKQIKNQLLALYLEGKLHFHMKNYDESMIKFQSIISIDEQFYKAYYRQAECYYQKYLDPNQKNKDEQLREATKKCLELIKIKPNHIKSYLFFVIIIRQKKEPQQLRKGIELLNQVIQTNGYNYKLLKKKGIYLIYIAYLHFLLKEYQQSIQIYEQILYKETNSKNSCYTMAILQLTIKNIESAIKYIRKALMIDKKYKKASDILGVIYIKFPDTKQLMLKELNLAVNYMPNDSDLKMLKLKILRDLNKHEEADNLEKEVAILKSKGFYDKNIQRDLLVFDSNKMYNYHDDSMKIWLQQIKIKIDQYYSQLQSTFQQYLPKQQNDKVINPPNQLAKSDIIVVKNLFALNLAREAYLQQDYKKGLNILEKFDQTDKQTKNQLLALYLLGKLYFQMKNYDESIINFQKIISLDDKFYKAYYKQAECYYQQYLVQNQKNKEEQLREATMICLELIKINPYHIKAYLFFVIIIRQKKEPQQLRKGIELLNQVIQSNGYNYKLLKKKGIDYTYLAYLHFLLREYQQSIQIYEQILQKEANSKNSYYTMAILQLKTENIDSAFKYIGKALMIDKEYKKASDILGIQQQQSRCDLHQLSNDQSTYEGAGYSYQIYAKQFGSKNVKIKSININQLRFQQIQKSMKKRRSFSQRQLLQNHRDFEIKPFFDYNFNQQRNECKNKVHPASTSQAKYVSCKLYKSSLVDADIKQIQQILDHRGKQQVQQLKFNQGNLVDSQLFHSKINGFSSKHSKYFDIFQPESKVDLLEQTYKEQMNIQDQMLKSQQIIQIQNAQETEFTIQRQCKIHNLEISKICINKFCSQQSRMICQGCELQGLHTQDINSNLQSNTLFRIQIPKIIQNCQKEQHKLYDQCLLITQLAYDSLVKDVEQLQYHLNQMKQQINLLEQRSIQKKYDEILECADQLSTLHEDYLYKLLTHDSFKQIDTELEGFLQSYQLLTNKLNYIIENSNKISKNQELLINQQKKEYQYKEIQIKLDNLCQYYRQENYIASEVLLLGNPFDKNQTNYNLAYINYKQNQLIKALEHLSQIQQDDIYSKGSITYLKGKIYMKQYNEEKNQEKILMQQITAIFNDLTIQKPQLIKAFYSYGIQFYSPKAKFLYFTQYYNEADQILIQSGALSNSPKFLQLKAQLDEAMGREPSEILKIYDKCLQLDYKNTLSYYKKGQLYIRVKQYEDALEMMDQVLIMDPRVWQALFYKCLINGCYLSQFYRCLECSNEGKLKFPQQKLFEKISDILKDCNQQIQ